MLEVSRYIHLNPVEAKMVKQPENYPWSSYYLFKYPNPVQPNFMNLECLLNYYEGTDVQKKERYCRSLGTRAMTRCGGKKEKILER
jgi:putative transposase